MAPTLCLVVGFNTAGVPTDLYIGNDYSAAEAAAAAASGYSVIRVYRNLIAYREYQFPPA
jgi:hypothetical protein